MNNNKKTAVFKTQTPWSKLSPQTVAMGEFVLQQLSLVTGLSGSELIEYLADRSGVHRSYIELFFGKVYMPTPYLLTSIICGAGLELWLVAKPLDQEGVQSEECYKVWVKSESDSKSAFKRLLSLVYGELPNMVTLSRLSQVRVTNTAQDTAVSAERMRGVSATKLQAFWHGHESLSWQQLENLLAAARLAPAVCIKTMTPQKQTSTKPVPTKPEPTKQSPVKQSPAKEDYSYLEW